MREHDRTEHDLFRQLLGFGFDHHHRVVRARDHQIEIAFGNLVVGRVQNVFATDIADPRCRDRSHERHAAQRQRRRRRDHRQNVGLVLAVIAHDLRDNVDLVIETFGEQRADRTVDQAADQCFLLGRAPLTLEKSAGNAARSGIFFLIVHGEREEILPFLDRTRRGHRAQHDGFAERRDHRAIGLPRHAPGFELQRLSAPRDFDCLHVEHHISFGPASPMLRGPLFGRRPVCQRCGALVAPVRPAGCGTVPPPSC